MSRTLGPILATGAVTIANQTIFHGEEMDWRVPIATGLAAIGFTLAERVAPEVAVILAWTTFITVMLSRTNPKVPSPVESAVTWWEKG
jgi:hypothetical protein